MSQKEIAELANLRGELADKLAVCQDYRSQAFQKEAERESLLKQWNGIPPVGQESRIMNLKDEEIRAKNQRDKLDLAVRLLQQKIMRLESGLTAEKTAEKVPPRAVVRASNGLEDEVDDF